MKAIILTLLISFFIVKGFGQTVYSDDQVIKISDYLTELEKRDSIIKSVLAGIDENLPGQGDNTKPKAVNICGKLTGLNKTQFPITDINLMLVKDNGETLTQKTSNNGNFNFKNVNPSENYSFKLSAEDTKIIQASKIIISDCSGKTVKIISKNETGFFEYKLLDVEKTQMSTESNGVAGGTADPVAKINTLKTNFEKLKADTKACEANVADLQKKFNELEKIFDALKSKPQDMDTDLQLYDSNLLSKYLKLIQFKSNDATLDEEAYRSLDALAVQLKKFPKVKFMIQGHADNSGTDAINTKLSQERADAVKAYLVSKAVDTKRISTQAMGSAYPIANNDVEEGRAKNRRVEIKAKK
ncbi:MAG: OmpA family protein [Bacteroidota bacterium]